MYMTVMIYTDWIWTYWAWFKVLWCDYTAGSVVEWFVYHLLHHDAGDCTANSVVKWFVHCCLCYGAGDCTADLIVEWFVHHHLCHNACWSVLTCGYTAAAGETGCETGGSGASLKIINPELFSTVIYKTSNNDMINWYWHWRTKTLEWNMYKAQFCSLNY